MVKVSNEVLKNVVFKNLGTHDPSIIVGPSVGEDAAIVRIDHNKYLVSHVDPITGSVELIGWLSIYVPANDIAVRGVIPKWFLTTILLPESEKGRIEMLNKIMRQIDNALKEINSSLIGGHTEYSPGISRPIIVSTAIGISDKYITTSNVKNGDYVIMTKAAALEATAIIATDFEQLLINKGTSREIIEKGKNFIKEVSVVKEALIATPYVNSMHDPTEGGIIQGLLEMVEASNKSIKIDLGKVKIREETKIILETLGIDPYRALSSGTLLLTVSRDKLDLLIREYERNGVEYSIIGKVIGNEKKLIISKNGETMVIKDFIQDEVMRFVEEYS